MTKGFLPFIRYFLVHGENPYNYFLQHNNVVFPYPAGMLYILSPLFIFVHMFAKNMFNFMQIDLLLFRIPILVADITIYLVLCKLLPSKENKVFLLYFLSPILFYINYFHGQLDVIPTAFLFISLYFLYIKKILKSFLLLGIGIAVKTHLVVVLPFYAVYLLRQKEKFLYVSFLIIFSIIIFVVVNIPLISKYFLFTVFNNVEQQRIYFTTIPYIYKNLTIFVAPAALLVSLFIFATSTKRMNFDSLILTLGLIFTILIALVPPMQGWFYWSIPLLIYFLIKYKDSHLFSYLMMNIFFFAYFIFTKDSDIFESPAASITALTTYLTPYQFLYTKGINALQIQNILFTCLQVSVAMNAYWCYRLGIYYNNLYIEKQKAFVIGIGGDSGVGKSTFSDGVIDIVGKKQMVILNGDDSHKWERHDTNWQYFTHLNPKSNKLHKDVEQIYALIDGKTIKRAEYDHKTGKFTKPQALEKNQFIVFQGLHPFYLEKMRAIYSLKIFMEAEETIRQKWKLERDKSMRGHTSAQVIHEINKRKKDATAYIKPQKRLADWVITYQLIDGQLSVKYTFNNSFYLEELISELSHIKKLTVSHNYVNTKKQTVTIGGTIQKDVITDIVYKLYPNITELLNNQLKIKENIQGINQLFLINFLNYYFINKNVTESGFEA